MKKKSIKYAIYSVVLLVVIVAALILAPKFTFKKDSYSNNGDKANSNIVSKPSSSDGSSENVKDINLNCNDNYTISLNSSILFKDGYYSCEIDVIASIESDSASFVDNLFKANKVGEYEIILSNSSCEKKINIVVKEARKDIILFTGVGVELKESNYIIENNFYFNGSTLFAYGVGESYLTETIEDNYTKIENRIKLVALPMFSIYDIVTGNNLEDDNLIANIENGIGNLIIEFNTDDYNVTDVEMKAGDKVFSAKDGGWITFELGEGEYNAELCLKLNGYSLIKNFTLFAIDLNF